MAEIAAIRICATPRVDTLQLTSIPEPGAPGPGDVHVRLQASSLNYHDYAVVTGAIRCREGRIPMSDGAGEVISVGEGVSSFKPGDLVLSTFFPEWADGRPTPQALRALPGDRDDGYAREQVVAPETWFTRAPAGYSAAEAATLPCAALTAWRALFVEGETGPGSTVLIQGTGGVSIFALQFAKAAGARVIATSSGEAKLERLRQLGADETINYRKNAKWGDTVLSLTNGAGVDTVIEVGGSGTLGESITAARIDGLIALIGVLAGRAGPVETARVMAKNLRIHGLTVGNRAQQIAMIAGIEATGIRPVISDRFPLAQLADAFRHQESGHHFGKIVVDI